MHDISHFEVALRNAYDAAISASWKGSKHWVLDPNSPLVIPLWRIRKSRGLKRGTDVNTFNRKTLDALIHKHGGVQATSGKIISELTFGF